MWLGPTAIFVSGGAEPDAPTPGKLIPSWTPVDAIADVCRASSPVSPPWCFGRGLGLCTFLSSAFVSSLPWLRGWDVAVWSGTITVGVIVWADGTVPATDRAPSAARTHDDIFIATPQNT